MSEIKEPSLTLKPRRSKQVPSKSTPPSIKSFPISAGEEIRWIPSETLYSNQWAVYDAEGHLKQHLMYYECEAINGILKIVNNPQVPVSIPKP